MTEDLEKFDVDNRQANEPKPIVSNPEDADTVVDFLPVDKQELSQYEADRIEHLINQNSPYKTRRGVRD